MEPGGDAGVAKIRADLRLNFGLGDSGLLTDEWKVAYNPTHFKRQLGDDAEVTLSRTDFKNAAWRYNLYHADGDQLGSRVELNSGFPFRTEGEDYGWMGYWGLWTPEDVIVEDGDTIYKHDFETGTEVPYTMHRAPGKLIRHTREFLPLTDLVGHTFHWWNDLDQVVYLVDYAAGFFNKIAELDEEKHVWIPIDPPIAIDVAGEGGYLHMWAESFGGTVSYVDGDDDVTYFEEKLVNGSSSLFGDAVDGVVTLHGFVQCLDSELSGEDAEQGAVYLPDKTDVSASYVFTFDQNDLTLRYDVNGDGSELRQVGLAEGQAPTMGPNMWGMRSGPMVLDTTGLTNPWDVWLTDVFYTYETGHNEWNGHATVVDSFGEHVEFDAPIQFLYTHAEINDLNEDPTYDGQKYFLSYGGPGDLWGIPHEGVDLTGDMEPDRYYPLFSIAGGTLVGPLGDEYILRPMEIEQTLQVDESGSAALDLTPAESLVLPDSTLYTVPDIGARPGVTGPPAVVNGRVVRSK